MTPLVNEPIEVLKFKPVLIPFLSFTMEKSRRKASKGKRSERSSERIDHIQGEMTCESRARGQFKKKEREINTRLTSFSVRGTENDFSCGGEAYRTRARDGQTKQWG